MGHVGADLSDLILNAKTMRTALRVGAVISNNDRDQAFIPREGPSNYRKEL
jgi:hypothetical protein